MRSLHLIHEALEAVGANEVGTGRGTKRIFALGLGIAAAVGLTILAAATLTGRRQAEAEKTFWAVDGPPCPTVSPIQILRIGRPLSQVFDFGAGRFSRVSGAVICKGEMDGMFGVVSSTVCQFNAPRAVAVGSQGGFAYFDVPGGPATVTVSRNAPPLCVRAANYRGE